MQNASEPSPQASGAAVGQLQVLSEQRCPPGQAAPQPPQLFASVVTSLQYAGASGGQVVSLLAQVRLQTPSEQSEPARQRVSQSPQWFGSVRVFVQNDAPFSEQASGVASGQAQLPPAHC